MLSLKEKRYFRFIKDMGGNKYYKRKKFEEHLEYIKSKIDYIIGEIKFNDRFNILKDEEIQDKEIQDNTFILE